MNPETRLTILASAVGEPTEGDHLVLDLESGRYFALGEVGSFVWTRLDPSRTVAEIAAEVADTYEVSPERALDEVLDFAASLVAADLAVPVGGAAAPDESSREAESTRGSGRKEPDR